MSPVSPLPSFTTTHAHSADPTHASTNGLQDVPRAGESEMQFVDRRQQNASSQGGERRQFGNSHHHLTQEGKLLAESIDAYKVANRRRYITTDELLSVLHRLGYKKVDS